MQLVGTSVCERRLITLLQGAALTTEGNLDAPWPAYTTRDLRQELYHITSSGLTTLFR
jgi:hypothetical protein